MQEQILPNGKQFRIEVLQKPDHGCRPFEIEILFLLQGKMDVKTDRHLSHMNAEDVLIVNVNEKYETHPAGEALYARLLIPFALFSAYLQHQNLHFVCDTSAHMQLSAADELRRLLRKLLLEHLNSSGTGMDYLQISICFQIVDHITKFFLRQAVNVKTESRKKQQEDRRQEIEQYLHANFRSDISIKDLAESLYLSTGHLSRVFKETYGMSFSDYLTWLRLLSAEEDLLYQNLTVTQIAFDNGFPNVASFHNAFRRQYGTTPGEYRKRVQKKQSADSESRIARERLKSYLWHETDHAVPESTGLEEAVLQSEETGLLDPVWRKIINIGPAAQLLRSGVQEHVILLKKTLKFQYIRFWNPFSRELLIDPGREDGRYNFTRLDQLLDFLLDQDLLPFIELGRKPERINQDARDALLMNREEPLADLKIWKNVLEAFLRHILKRYGREEISRWMFELWFDYDRCDCSGAEAYGAAVGEEISVYSERFKITQELIRKYSNAGLWGSGFHAYGSKMDKKRGTASRIMEKLSGLHVMPDCISAYCYPYDTYYDGSKPVSVRSRSGEYLLQGLKNLQEETGKESIAFCEWNLTFSDRNILNDTCFRGAWLMANCIRTAGKVSCLACFNGTDRVSEYVDSDEFLFGGNGLLNKEGVLKPAGYALFFLNQLHSGLIAAGEHYLLTTDGNGAYSLVCHNCKELNDSYYLEKENALDREHPNRYFKDLEQLTLKLHIQGAENGLYQMKTYRMNDRTGAIQQVWSQMGFDRNLSKPDIRYVRNVCVPSLTIQTQTVTSEELGIHVNLEANEMMLIILYRMTE